MMYYAELEPFDMMRDDVDVLLVTVSAREAVAVKRHFSGLRRKGNCVVVRSGGVNGQPWTWA